MNLNPTRLQQLGIGAAFAGALFISACGSQTPAPQSGSTMASFALPDLNPNSTTFNKNIGPSTYTGKVSAWYFTHTT